MANDFDRANEDIAEHARLRAKAERERDEARRQLARAEESLEQTMKALDVELEKDPGAHNRFLEQMCKTIAAEAERDAARAILREFAEKAQAEIAKWEGKWETQEAVDGHEWGKRPGDKWVWCRICGNVRRHDKQNKLCRGPVKLRKMEKWEGK